MPDLEKVFTFKCPFPNYLEAVHKTRSDPDPTGVNFHF